MSPQDSELYSKVRTILDKNTKIENGYKVLYNFLSTTVELVELIKSELKAAEPTQDFTTTSAKLCIQEVNQFLYAMRGEPLGRHHDMRRNAIEKLEEVRKHIGFLEIENTDPVL